MEVTVEPGDVDIEALLDEEKIDTDAAAIELGMTAKHVSDLCKSGRLVAFKPGKYWQIPVSEVRRYLLESCNKTAQKPAGDGAAARALEQVRQSGQ